jgi:ATP-dependent DNA ligase
MEAQSVDKIPEGKEWLYEPKWDGFRCVAFRDGRNVELQSKSQQTLTRYFPEVADALRKLKASRFALDGELVVPSGRTLSFDALLQRIHPAATRVARLARETPAAFIVFDLLAETNGRSLLDNPQSERRELLERFAAKYLADTDAVHISLCTAELSEARKWLSRKGATTDGVIAKRRDLAYASGERTAMQKIKLFRTADCVVGGFRYGTKTKVVGSLLLGLYDHEGLLHHVGFTSSIAVKDRPALTRKLKALEEKPGFTGKAPGGPSRWTQGKETAWIPLRPKLVVEVSYDHVTGGRFRHGTQLLRWRPDKAPKQCTMEQLEQRSAHFLRLLK